MDVRVPQLAEGADSGTVVNIFVSEGDRIQKNQTICELENQKAVAPIPSPSSGTVKKIHVKQGDVVSVGQTLISIAEEEETAAPKEKASKETAPPRRELKEPEPQLSALPGKETEVKAGESAREASVSGTPPPAAPSVRKLARELGIDLAHVRGSERGGRITLKDVRDYLQRLQKAAAAQKTAPAPASPGDIPPVRAAGRSAPEKIDFSKWGPVTRKPVSSLRKTIAVKMQEAWSTIPHVTQFDEADITRIMDLKKKAEPITKAQKIHLTLTPFLLKAVSAVLKKHPIFNASLDESTGEIITKQYIHIGVAVDTEAGLIVPVIRDVDKKNLLELSKELDELAEKTRQRKVSAEEIQGGTFTISNQGGIGGAHFTPIIRKPEVAILGVGRASVKPVLIGAGKNEKVEGRLKLPLGLSYDHRVIDGADAARFISALVDTLENFPEKEVKIGKDSHENN